MDFVNEDFMNNDGYIWRGHWHSPKAPQKTKWRGLSNWNLGNEWNKNQQVSYSVGIKWNRTTTRFQVARKVVGPWFGEFSSQVRHVTGITWRNPVGFLDWSRNSRWSTRNRSKMIYILYIYINHYKSLFGDTLVVFFPTKLHSKSMMISMPWHALTVFGPPRRNGQPGGRSARLGNCLFQSFGLQAFRVSVFRKGDWQKWTLVKEDLPIFDVNFINNVKRILIYNYVYI
jgi:hypothetical protein